MQNVYKVANEAASLLFGLVEFCGLKKTTVEKVFVIKVDLLWQKSMTQSAEESKSKVKTVCL